MTAAWPKRTWPSLWIDAAKVERDRRAERYPRLIADRKITEDEATADYQAWCAIADWLAHGSWKLIGGWGGTADPPVIAITWPYMQERAKAALDTIETKILKECDPATERTIDGGQLAALRERRCAVEGIHEIVKLQREMIERTSRAPQRGREQVAA